MDTKLQEALKKANTEVEKSGIVDPELKKIAFSKAVDFYLQEKPTSILKSTEKKEQTESEGLDFWSSFSHAVGRDIKELKDVYTIKGEQILLVLSSIPGSTKAEKQRNLSALVILAYQEGLNREWVSSTNLAEAAAHSKLYDKSRFSKNIKSDWFRFEGVKKGLKYRLSGPGTSGAKILLESLIR